MVANKSYFRISPRGFKAFGQSIRARIDQSKVRPQFCNEPLIKLDNFRQSIKETDTKIAPLIQATLLSREIANLEQFDVGKSPLTSAITPLEILAKAVKSPNILQDYWPVEMMSFLMPDSLPKNIWKLYLSYALKLAQKYQSCLQNLLSSLLPVILLISLLIANIILFGADAALGPNQFALLIAGMTALGIGVWGYKQEYKKIEHQIITSISLSLQAMLILILVGALIGLWILSGVVPTMIYYGLKLIHPMIFLPIACIICCIVSLSTGSSWSTTGTVGIALIGIGQAFDIPMGMTAGAIISGAYFGDKLSPLSDTTNLAPAMAGTDLFTHVRHMLYTTIPAIILAIIGFSILGIWYHGTDIQPAKPDIVVENVLQVWKVLECFKKLLLRSCD